MTAQRMQPARIALYAFTIAAGTPIAALAQERLFTQAQSDTGRALYMQSCTSCHAVNLSGGAGTALAGPVFAKNWATGTRKLHDLYTVVSTTMPLNAPGTLTADNYLAITAFLLSQNGYGAGAKALTPEGLDVLIARNAQSGVAAPTAAQANASYPITPQSSKPASTQVVADSDLRNIAPGDWLTYNRTLQGDRYSPLSQINTANVSTLVPQCIFQLGEVGNFENSPIAYAGTLYINGRYKTYALNGADCTVRWEHTYTPLGPEHGQTAGRGLGIYQGKVFRGTGDGHVLALDAATGKLLWDIPVTNPYLGYSISMVPVGFDGKVFVGESGADAGLKGRAFAFDAETGKLVWSFDLVPTGKQLGANTWLKPESAEHGGASVWSSVTIDAQQGLVYFPTGNPGPDQNGDTRPGDNLFTDSVVALHIESGKLAWYAQQVAHDTHDWDTAAAPAIYERGGRSYMAVASKDGYLHIYDRKTHKELSRTETMGPRVNVGDEGSYETPVKTCPGGVGQWNGAGYSPDTGMLFVGAEYRCTTVQKVKPEYIAGQNFLAGKVSHPDELDTVGYLKGFDATTGKEIWSYKDPLPVNAAVTPTAGGLLFTGDGQGYFLAMEQKTGAIRYRFMTGGYVAGGISTYSVDDQQYVAVASGNQSRGMPGSFGAATLIVFGLPGHAK
jgi:PQQ-dependent dehydrogenase (methanol/ethanol family)